MNETNYYLIKTVKDIDKQLLMENTAEQTYDLIPRKYQAIGALHRNGLISDEELEKFILSDDPLFTPIINVSI